MNPGTLDRKVLIQRQADGLPLVTPAGAFLTDAAGNKLTTNSRKARMGAKVDVWGLWKTRRARRISKSGDEGTSNGREVGRSVVVYRIRYTRGIKLTDRLIEDGLAYDIVDIQEVGRRLLQDLVCVLHSNERPA